MTVIEYLSIAIAIVCIAARITLFFPRAGRSGKQAA
jgi:hypothetical protein